jgi:hypothetical protein
VALFSPGKKVKDADKPAESASEKNASEAWITGCHLRLKSVSLLPMLADTSKAKARYTRRSSLSPATAAQTSPSALGSMALPKSMSAGAAASAGRCSGAGSAELDGALPTSVASIAVVSSGAGAGAASDALLQPSIRPAAAAAARTPSLIASCNMPRSVGAADLACKP